MIEPDSFDSAVTHAFEFAVDAVIAGRIPGAILGVVTRAGRRAVRLTGHKQLLPTLLPLTDTDQFDLASLTKVSAYSMYLKHVWIIVVHIF